MGCNCNQYARDYGRMVELAQKQANIEKVEYIVYQKKDGSYGYNKREFIPEGSAIQFNALPIY